ncbi:MAG: hypothetical protein K5739_07310 [Lachnospiraceae bacterium]|nr:hypothetical protein [Lachnospiraceae bacterium]
MSLRDLCRDFWDDIVSLMDVRILEKLVLPVGGYSRMDALHRYLRLDPDFLLTLGKYLHLDREEMIQEMALLEIAS